jgi:hypothetical protein
LGPLQAFFVAVCHALQEGENELTATDAYWLGLVDEVVGEQNLLSSRNFREFQDDSQLQQQNQGDTEPQESSADATEKQSTQKGLTPTA